MDRLAARRSYHPGWQVSSLVTGWVWQQQRQQDGVCSPAGRPKEGNRAHPAREGLLLVQSSSSGTHSATSTTASRSHATAQKTSGLAAAGPSLLIILLILVLNLIILNLVFLLHFLFHFRILFLILLLVLLRGKGMQPPLQ